MKRRLLLKGMAGAGLVLPFGMALPRMTAFAQSIGSSPFLRRSSQGDRVMVILRLMGGNDGLNTVIPYQDDLYYKARGWGTPYDISLAGEKVLKLSDSATLGLHPNLASLHELYSEGKVAIVQNVGYPEPNLSHFRSTDIWLSGSDADVFTGDGWYGRYLEELHPEYPGVLQDAPFAIELGTVLSSTLMGRRNPMGITFNESKYIPGAPGHSALGESPAAVEERFLEEIGRQTHFFSTSIDAALQRQRSNRVPYDQGKQLQHHLSLVARMIASGLDTQLYIVNIDGYDHHGIQAPRHAELHQYFADGVIAFQRDLESFRVDHRVSMMTISEFGRRVIADGDGTDHGAASMLFVIGSGVNGGLIGSDPDLADLDEAGNLKMKIDFRQVYSSVLTQWFDLPSDRVYPEVLTRPFEQIPIFKSSSEPTPLLSEELHLGQSFPNPALDLATIECSGIGEGGGELVVYASDGSRAYASHMVAGQENIGIDVREFAAGSYIYELSAGDRRISRKMIVKR